MLKIECNDDKIEIEMDGLSGVLLTELCEIVSDVINALVESDAQKKVYRETFVKMLKGRFYEE